MTKNKLNIYVIYVIYFLFMTINIDISKISSKGQILIPKKMRKLFKEGDSVVFIEEDNRIILKNMNSISENFKEDLSISKKIDEAYKRYDERKFVSLSEENFLKEIKEW